MHKPGWQVAVSKRAWDQCVESAVADREDEVSRLADLLYFFWGALQNTPQSGLVAGFGFEVGHFVSDLKYSPPGPDLRHAKTVLLAVLACIGRSGAPQLVVLSLDEAGFAPPTR
jgi:hypothetical protein